MSRISFIAAIGGTFGYYVGHVRADDIALVDGLAGFAIGAFGMAILLTLVEYYLQ